MRDLFSNTSCAFGVAADTSSNLRDDGTRRVAPVAGAFDFKRLGAGARAIFRGRALAGGVPRAHAAAVPLALALADMVRGQGPVLPTRRVYQCCWQRSGCRAKRSRWSHYADVCAVDGAGMAKLLSASLQRCQRCVRTRHVAWRVQRVARLECGTHVSIHFGAARGLSLIHISEPTRPY